MNIFRLLGVLNQFCIPAKALLTDVTRHRGFVPLGIHTHLTSKNTINTIMSRCVILFLHRPWTNANTSFATRYFVQNPSTLCWRLRRTLPRSRVPLGFAVQLFHESILHRKQRIYPISYEIQIPVCGNVGLRLLSAHSITLRTIYRPTHDPSIDTFRIEYLLGPCIILALIFNYAFAVTEVLWSFSIFLESVAILPQLFMLQRTGEAETITTHYLAALGIYRALYIPNWIYRHVHANDGHTSVD